MEEFAMMLIGLLLLLLLVFTVCCFLYRFQPGPKTKTSEVDAGCPDFRDKISWVFTVQTLPEMVGCLKALGLYRKGNLDLHCASQRFFPEILGGILRRYLLLIWKTGTEMEGAEAINLVAREVAAEYGQNEPAFERLTNVLSKTPEIGWLISAAIRRRQDCTPEEAAAEEEERLWFEAVFR